MRSRSVLCAVVVWLAAIFAASLHAQGSLRVARASLPGAIAGTNYRGSVVVNGGAQPYTWQIADGKLPPGLKLNPARGSIVGIPSTLGTYNFSLAVTDSGIPAQRVVRAYAITVTAALTIDWKTPPVVHGQMLEGSVVVSNLAQQDVTLTVIIMGVNQIGRATALGYQEFTLASGAEQVIPFGSSPGPGTYIVHADAVAESASSSAIYRARKQTAQSLAIEAPE